MEYLCPAAPDSSIQHLTSGNHIERLSILCWTRLPDRWSLGTACRMSSSLELDPREESFKNVDKGISDRLDETLQDCLIQEVNSDLQYKFEPEVSI
jgi:hypothetical protein